MNKEKKSGDSGVIMLTKLKMFFPLYFSYLLFPWMFI